MRALKALVIIMGVAIVVSAAFLVTVIVQRAGNLGNDGGPVAVPLPAGASVVESRLDGGRALLRLELGGGGQALLVLDLDTGRLLHRLDLVPEKGPATLVPAVPAPERPVRPPS